MDLSSGFAERPVFVTGGDGFVGSHLVEKLVELKADVHVFVRSTSTKDLINIDHLSGDLTVHRGDLRDKYSVDSALDELEDASDVIVFHLAAQAHVGESWTRPFETVRTNVLGTLNLLQSIVEKDIDVFKFDTAGTSEEYGNIDEEKVESYRTNGDGSILLNERSPVNPHSIYATSKLAADYLSMNFYHGYDLPTVTTRMFNNYGPRQNPRFITGTVISQAIERDTVELGALYPKRDMCYVSDGIRGHLYAALEGTPGEQYVYGYGENVSMRDWVNMILDIGARQGYWERPEIVQREDRFRPGDSDVEELLVGYEKIHRETGWEPDIDWENGIRRTIDWYVESRPAWIGRVDWK